MVHLMPSDMDSLCLKKKVRMENQDDEDPFLFTHKRPKLDSATKCDSSDDDTLGVPQGFYNPLDEPSPLGLRLRKSPSLLDLIQMRPSQQHDSRMGDQKGSGGGAAADSKLKASNFPGTVLKIGTWEYKSRYEGDLVAKCYFAKHKLVWEVLDGCLKNKIEIPWSDIMALKANYPEDAPGTLEVVLARRPLFFREINPQPRKHTLWQATSDFTGGQASIQRRHFMQCPQGLLGKHFEKLIQCDPRLNFLSQQPELVLESPYFESGTAIHDHIESSDGFDSKSEEQPSLFGLHEVESGSAVQSSSSRSEHNLMGKAVENVSQEITSPSTVMNSHAIKDFRSRGAETLKFLSNLDQIKLPGLHPSMSMDDLVNHIGHCISTQMTSENSKFGGDSQQRTKP
uniref:TRF2/HOY1 PH-like domain-containing protein n=1 Tax=Lotus japonicus TaxID=34305 RepID=I3S9E8_LOTJA|nr:unknown [Lotus japonicus]